ncbi:MAG: hypothetical protein M3Q39_11210 [Actinomycetota bacterium]|nr:hypothetical protein [Actinomycetota bacterium]
MIVLFLIALVVLHDYLGARRAMCAADLGRQLHQARVLTGPHRSRR